MTMICEYKSVEEPVMNYLKELGWSYLSQAEIARLRENNEKTVVFETVIRSILKKLNNLDSEQLDQVVREIYKIKDGEEFQNWLRNEHSIRLKGEKNSTTINLVDYKNINNNIFQFTNQFRVEGNFVNNKPDLVLFLNGFPIILIEAKSPEVGLDEGINQILRYQREMHEFFKYNQFNISLDGNKLKYASTNSPKQFFFEWRAHSEKYNIEDKYEMKKSLFSLLNKETVLDLVENFIVYSKEDNQTIKKICRFQQYEATNLVYNRVLKKEHKLGLIWHTQGSGKTMTMFFTAWKLWRELQLNKPTILLISDRVDLGDQTQGVFESLNLQGIEKITKIEELKEKINNDARGIFVCLIQKFNPKKLITSKAERDNIIILIDEGHRTQEGDFGSVLRKVFTNACLFSYTGTPVQKGHKNTFKLYSPKKDGKLLEDYLHRYSQEDGIRDGTVLPIRYLYKYQEVMLTKSELDEKYFEITDNMEDEEREKFEQWLLKPENIDTLRKRISKIVKDLEEHYRLFIEPNGFKAQIVAPNRIACTIYKEELDKIRPIEESELVMSIMHNDKENMLKYKKSKQEIKLITKNFKKSENNPKFLIVTDMLLTGFDAPIEKVMYLDKRLKDHTLLQAIARTNRPAKNKGFGLIVDYSGILGRLKDALNFEDKDIKNTFEPVDTLKKDFDLLLNNLMSYFKDLDSSSNEFYADCYNKIKYSDDKEKTKFYDDINELKTLYETISPDPFLVECNRNDNYKFLIKLYLALRREENPDKYDFDELGEKTKQLLEQNIHFGSPKSSNITYSLEQIKSYIEEDSGSYNLSHKLDEKYTKIIKIEEFKTEMKYDSIIRSISDRLEEMIKSKMKENKLTQDQISKLILESKEFRELEEIRILKEENNLSDTSLSVFNILNKQLDEPEDFLLSLSKKLDSYLEKTLFVGWTKKESLEKDLALHFLKIIREELPNVEINMISDLIQKLIKVLKDKDAHETNTN